MKIENIKFKAKRLDNAEWVVGDLSHLIDGVYITNDNGCYMAQVDPSAICQFTGLKDCEGNEIWEHDLLQSQKTKAIYEVVWDEGDFTLSDYVVGVETMVFLCSALRTSRIKVIGNKFDKEK